MPENPVNSAVFTARVALLAPLQIWLRGPAGELFRAWAPQDALSRMVEDVEVQVYMGGEGELNGWWDPQSGLAVNQRRLKAAERPDFGVSLACRGRCGLVWRAPAPDRMLDHEEHCLTCGGELQAA